MIYIDMKDVTSDVVINSSESYTITGNSDKYNINVNCQLATVYLQSVNINLSNISKAAINIQDNSDATFILSGTNNVYSGVNFAGIQMNEECSITIMSVDSSSTINVYSGISGAGIGSGFGEDFKGNISIKSGNINITSTREGAGIGGGNGGNGGGNFLGTLTIDGGNINIETGVGGGAGIGGGERGDLAGNVIINGGNINCSQADNGIGAGIGGGCDGNLSGSILINSGKIIAIGGEGSAGIGGGFKLQRGGSLSGTVIINGGTTVAYGGLYISTNEGAAGIGGGYSGDFLGDVKFIGGDITAKGAGTANDVGTGSNGVDTGNVNIKIKDIEVNPKSLMISVGESWSLTTTVIFEPGIAANIDQYSEIEYTSEDTNIAKVNQSGLVTSVGPGQTNIFATCMADKSKSDICNVDVDGRYIVIGDIDLLIEVDKNQIKEEDLDNIISYGNNPIITDICLEENIRNYKCYIRIPGCKNNVAATAQYKEVSVFLSVIYSIALLKSNNCLQDLKIYALENSGLSTCLSFCLDIKKFIDVNSFEIALNTNYKIDKEYSKKYYLFNVTGTVELLSSY